eukprot:8674540-Ditylum_brightwellii.AAC.1
MPSSFSKSTSFATVLQQQEQYGQAQQQQVTSSSSSSSSQPQQQQEKPQLEVIIWMHHREWGVTSNTGLPQHDNELEKMLQQTRTDDEDEDDFSCLAL